jgi:hypothetical protein
VRPRTRGRLRATRGKGLDVCKLQGLGRLVAEADRTVVASLATEFKTASLLGAFAFSTTIGLPVAESIAWTRGRSRAIIVDRARCDDTDSLPHGDESPERLRQRRCAGL